MESPSPLPPDSDTPPPSTTTGLPAAIWVVGVIVILALFMWLFRS